MRKDPIEMLERCHGRLDERLRELCDQLREGDREAAEDNLCRVLKTLARHFADEEQSIFPRLDGCESLIEQLTAEHRAHEETAAALERAVVEGHDEALVLARRLADALDAHATIEDNELMHRVENLDAAQLAEVAQEMQARRGGGGGRR